MKNKVQERMCANDMMKETEQVRQKLNIGYLIPDWRAPEVAFFREELLTKYNKAEFHLFCYVYDGKVKDFGALQDGHSRWRDIEGLRPEVVVRMIREDGVDVLVDLSGYKAAPSMAMLERKAAAIQVVFIGYFNTTGLRTVDYLLSDKYCNAKEQKDVSYSEKLYCLPHTHFCYNGWSGVPVKREIPFKKNQYITFGCFWNLIRVQDEFLTAWAQILSCVSTARLILASRIFGSGYGRQEMRYRLARLGFDTERVEFRTMDQAESKAGFADVDIMLDTYPYQGGVRVCDALYAGIPVIVLAGKKHYYRFGYSILKNVGLEECIGFGLKDYIRKAVTLAGNPYKLVNLHKNLQERMMRSPLMDVRRYVGNVERAYREMWLERLAAKRQSQARTEILAILGTVEEGLIFVRSHLPALRELQMIRQILTDIQLTLAYVNKMSQDGTSAALAAKFMEDTDLLLTQYARRQYEKICADIDGAMLPGLKKWRTVLKMSTVISQPLSTTVDK